MSEFKSIVSNVMTFGASGRVDNAVKEFEELHNTYEELYSKMERRREETNNTFEQVIKVKVECVKSLQRISKISRNLQGKDRELLYRKLGNEVEVVDFKQVESTLSAFNQVMNLTKGASVGVSTALGAWALVSTFGSASTGAAIAGLSGAAATNATLAWFGGGALAAGGGGMALGTAALGGIVVIPALLIAGLLSHVKANKQIKEIQEHSNELLGAIDTVTSNIAKIDYLERRSLELVSTLEKAHDVFNTQFERVYHEIYPHGFWSRLAKGIRKSILRRSYFSDSDVVNIAHIGGIATDFAKMIDTKVLEQEGA